ncbi:response regulator [Parvibacter caecicola]|uniref:histidine kinase n=1 Tax=Parvibacter caecicola TaxID=747645 RepID=A0A7W5D202_9ACTN|nr:response regulator [Parvibacter caecicola]MBB3171192.1 signal transduction histidine kinase/DNA-binding response OmpR family regulator [Parvibacter caecicola]MCR2042016.1 response regulator [Parvibacter caecicola]
MGQQSQGRGTGDKATGAQAAAVSREWMRRLPAVAAAVVVALMVAFFGITLNNTMATTAQMDAIRAGAYPVSVAAGRVETQLVQMRTLSSRVIYVRTASAIDGIENSYEEIDAELSRNIQLLAEEQARTGIEGNSIQGDYQRLLEAQAELIAFCRDPEVTDAEVERFVTRSIEPIVSQLLHTNAVIMDNSTYAVEQLYVEGAARGEQTVTWAVVLMVAVVLSLALYLYLFHRRWVLQQQLQHNVEEALELAQNASDAKSQFLSNMSHDIRTPMNAIVGLTTIAGSHVDDPERMRECLGRISTSSKHLLCLINDVLDMSKIESGKIVLNEECFSFPEMVSELVTIVQPQAKSKDQQLEIVIGNVSQETVMGDSMRLNQALLNILGNAVKYTPEGGTIRFTISEGPAADDAMRIYWFTVADNGIGMSADFVRHMFDPFEREETAAVKATEGTGLGMAITKNVVEMMGGTIEVESAPSEGSTFRVAVPLRPVPDGEGDADFSAMAGMRVLVVDDDPDVLTGAVEMLVAEGLRGEAASGGRQAVSMVAEAHAAGDDYRAIVVDWVMADMDGVETVRQVRRKMAPTVPIILLSAYDWAEVEDEARAAGVTEFLSKPLFRSQLCRVLSRCCGFGQPPAHGQRREERRQLQGRVLLVEDNELNSDIACELIRQTGAQVETAVNGAEAVDMVAQAPDGYYDLVFMDMRMPVMGGLEAARAICDQACQEGRKRPSIVAMTANAFASDRNQALAAGMDGFMTKPIDVRELERTLNRYLGK